MLTSLIRHIHCFPPLIGYFEYVLAGSENW